MDQYKKIAANPIFFERNRVFRVYKGGKLFHDFFGDEPIDNNYPEEWVASNVHALNKESAGPKEGVSKIQGTEIYFDDLLEQEQTEAWLILATRENAKIYFGFKNKMNKEDFLEVVKKTEKQKDIMTSYVNEVPVKKGDVFLINAKLIHAIGAGCLLLEVQEPTDFTIQPETWCGTYKLDEEEMYLGLGEDIALDCFNYNEYGQVVVEKGKKKPMRLESASNVQAESLINEQHTSCFALNRYIIAKDSMTLPKAPAVYMVTEGVGELTGKDYQRTLEKGDYFFIPYALKQQYDVQTEKGIELVECLPPKKKE